jgi:glutamyl-tRNA synthetase
MLFYFKPPQDYDEKGIRKHCKKEILNILQELYQDLNGLENFNIENIKDIFDKVTKKYDLKLIKIAQPVRIALTGKTISPGVFEMLEILGKDVSLSRIKRLIDYIKTWSE